MSIRIVYTLRLTTPPKALFGENDLDDVVAASTACRFCLRTAMAVDVAPTEDRGGVARCYCAVCREATDLRLDPAQLRRLLRLPVELITIYPRSHL